MTPEAAAWFVERRLREDWIGDPFYAPRDMLLRAPLGVFTHQRGYETNIGETWIRIERVAAARANHLFEVEFVGITLNGLFSLEEAREIVALLYQVAEKVEANR